VHGDLKALALQTHPALQDDEKSNDLRKKLEARKALSAATTQVHHGAFGTPFVHCPPLALPIETPSAIILRIRKRESASPRARIMSAFCSKQTEVCCRRPRPCCRRPQLKGIRAKSSLAYTAARASVMPQSS
jgi:hypothetical protein